MSRRFERQNCPLKISVDIPHYRQLSAAGVGLLLVQLLETEQPNVDPARVIQSSTLSYLQGAIYLAVLNGV